MLRRRKSRRLLFAVAAAVATAAIATATATVTVTAVAAIAATAVTDSAALPSDTTAADDLHTDDSRHRGGHFTLHPSRQGSND